jgi:ferredoxin
VPIPQINSAKCNGCGLCVSVCEQCGLVIRNTVVEFVGGDKCTWCGMCEAVCPSGAINCPFVIVLDER